MLTPSPSCPAQKQPPRQSGHSAWRITHLESVRAFHGPLLLLVFEETGKYLRRRGFLLECLG
jgi:hypothetical protein